MPWLLDTNILSEIRRPKPEPKTKVLSFIAACPLDELYISTVTLAELRFGIERLDAGERRIEPLACAHSTAHVPSKGFASERGHAIPVAGSDGRRPQSRAYLFAARFDYCRNCASPRVHSCHTRPRRLRQSRSDCHQSVAIETAAQRRPSTNAAALSTVLRVAYWVLCATFLTGNLVDFVEKFACLIT
jgi:hypothetical protein